MPFSLTLSPVLHRAGWHVKIFDREQIESPHVTVLRRVVKWRIDLRDRSFMDRTPDPKDVPEEVMDIIRAHWEQPCRQWDIIHPENPVEDEEGDDD